MKTLKILETMWFAIALLAVSFGVYQLVKESFTESIGYFIIALLAFAFGLVRHKQRMKKQE